MLIYKAWQYKTQFRDQQSQSLPLISVIHRDTIVYFVVNVVLYVGNFGLLRWGDDSLGPLIVGITVAIESVLGNRMLINLRAADEKPLSGDTENTLAFRTSTAFFWEEIIPPKTFDIRCLDSTQGEL